MKTLNNILKVKITQKSMRDGNYESTQDCPLAQALKKQYPKRNIGVGGYNVNIGDYSYAIDKESEDILVGSVGTLTSKSLTVTLTKNK